MAHCDGCLRWLIVLVITFSKTAHALTAEAGVRTAMEDKRARLTVYEGRGGQSTQDRPQQQ